MSDFQKLLGGLAFRRLDSHTPERPMRSLCAEPAPLMRMHNLAQHQLEFKPRARRKGAVRVGRMMVDSAHSKLLREPLP